MDDFKARMDPILDKLGFNLLLLVKVVLIVLLAFVAERVIRILLKRSFLKSDQGNEDRTRYRFLRNATRFLVGLFAVGTIIYSIPSFKHVAVTLFAGAGILVAILGLAAQGAFSNIISGVFIVSFKPFRVGDSISVGTHSGVVEDITLRHTVMVNAENRRIIIPNSKISDETIVNNTIVDPAICQYVEIGISYGSDPDHAMAIMREEAQAHPSCLDRRTPEEKAAKAPIVQVRVIGLADSSVTLRAYVWAEDNLRAVLMRYDLYRSIKLQFAREGIEIPFPTRKIIHEGAAGNPASPVDPTVIT